jgi:hypothetical protein
MSASRAKSKAPKKKHPAGPGRPCTFDPERAAKIVNALTHGAIVDTAVAMAGVPRSTFYLWLKTQSAQCQTFAEQVNQAVASAEVNFVTIIADAATKTWQAAAWMLERRWPRSWARRDYLAGGDGGAIQVNVDDVRKRIADRIAGIAERKRAERDSEEPVGR